MLKHVDIVPPLVASKVSLLREGTWVPRQPRKVHEDKYDAKVSRKYQGKFGGVLGGSSHILPSGKRLHSYWKWSFIVDLPI